MNARAWVASVGVRNRLSRSYFSLVQLFTHTLVLVCTTNVGVFPILSDQSKLIYPTVRIDSISIHTERGRDGIHKLGALIQIGQHSCHKRIKDINRKRKEKDLLLTVSRKASTQKAMEMNRAKISSVDRVDHRLRRETSNSE